MKLSKETLAATEKIASKELKTLERAALVRKKVVADYDSLVRLSWEVVCDYTFLLFGQFGVGKTTMAASASEAWPKGGLPKVRHKGAKPSAVLEDMFWISADKGATRSFRERGISVPEFSIPAYLSQNRHANITNALEKAIELAVVAVSKRKAKWVVVDTLTSVDGALESHWRRNCPETKSGKDDTRRMYGNVFYGHKLLNDALITVGAGVIVCCHAKAIDDISKLSEEEKRRVITLTAIGMPEFLPAITGKGATAWKAHVDLQLALVAKDVPRTGLVRRAYTISKGWETKSRFELSLPVELPCDIGKIREMVEA